MTLQEKRTSMQGEVEAWRSSGMTQAGFARQHNITLSKFRYRVYKIRTTSNMHQPSASASGFIRLADHDLPFGRSGHEIRLRYPNGVWLALPVDTPAAVVKTLIDF